MNKLAELLDDEDRRKSQKSRNGMTRHSRFGTTLTVRAVRGLSLSQLVYTGETARADWIRETKSSYCTSKTPSLSTPERYWMISRRSELAS